MSIIRKVCLVLGVVALCLQAPAWALSIHGHANNGTSGSATINVPTNTNGDLLVWAVCTLSSAPTTPSGWNLYASQVSTGNPGIFIYTRIASSEPTSYTLSGGNFVGMDMASISGANSSTTLDGSAFTSVGSATSLNTPALSGLSTSSDLLLGVYHYGDNASGSCTLTENGSLTKVGRRSDLCKRHAIRLLAGRPGTQQHVRIDAGGHCQYQYVVVGGCCGG
jgi:hypothetical protein